MRLDGPGQAVLHHGGRTLRLTVADGDLPLLLQIVLSIHADVPASNWPAWNWPGLHTTQGACRLPDPALSGAAAVAPAASSVVEAGLRHLLAHVGAARAGGTDGIHQTRVALRRLRSALALFAPYLDPGTTGALAQELRTLGRALGAARDWDVFCLHTLPDLSSGVVEAGTLAAAAHLRKGAHAAMAEALDDASLLRLMGIVTDWAGAAGTGAAGPRLRKAAPALLSALERKVRRRGRHIDRRTEHELHALRRATKGLRYGIEFLRPLFPRKAVKDYLHACEALQASLGELNDMANALHLARGLAGDAPLPPSPEAAMRDRILQGRLAAAIPAIHAGWRRFERTAPFWS